MKLVRNGKMSFLQPSGLEDGIVAGFSARNGGVSRPPYNSLNLGLNTEDHLPNVEGNRSTFARSFDLQPHQLLTVKQVHGNDLLIIDEPNLDLTHFLSLEVDAIVTNQPDIMIGVLVADCYPVLLWDSRKQVVAAVHVGWRGAANGILKKVVNAMQQHFDCQPAELKAAIGPGIGAHKYEVDRPVRDAFRKGSGFWSEISTEIRLGHWQLDIGLSCRLQLEQVGLKVNSIAQAKECTCCHPELLFSYRRDNGKTGRQIGFIKLSK
ncbi:peptidoglycan editing factor PgeF [Malonomonas rubra]|uniref:peptidoglycan editing factor PgeF n=1 Tax=Malonomonas rubra TaxID=57040 RepID=UPI0026EA221A|nr:peptidoglycan editing factor PgeF [Malonomonas rubra]